jgi:hypothetical protein
MVRGGCTRTDVVDGVGRLRCTAACGVGVSTRRKLTRSKTRRDGWFGPCIVLGMQQDPLLARSVLTSSSALVSFFVGLGRRDFPRWNDSRALSIRNDQVFKTNHSQKSKR